MDFPYCSDGRLMGVCEPNGSKDLTGQISNGYTLVLRFFDFIFCSEEKIDKGKRHMRAFYLVLSSPFNGGFRAGEGDRQQERESKEDTRQQHRQTR